MPRGKKYLNDFNGIEIEIEYQKIVDKYGRKTAKDLRQVSPKSNRPGRTTPYSQGWVVDTIKSSRGYVVDVWNKTNWQLTHLLENGHFITNAKSGNVGWSAPKPHIKPTYIKVKPKFVDAMKKAELNVKFK